METKEQIRKRLIHERDMVHPDVWDKKSTEIERKILKSNLYKDCEYLLVYADFHGEAGTNIIVEDALLKNKKVYFPKVLEGFEESKMDFYRVIDTFELLEGYKGIKEPTGNIEKLFDYEKCKGSKILMLVPGVSFDKEGNRLGYGKGYYDNYLRNKPEIVTVALCFDFQIQELLPYSDGDVKIKYLCSECTSTAEINKMHF